MDISFTTSLVCKPLTFSVMRVKLRFHFSFTRNHLQIPPFERESLSGHVSFKGQTMDFA